MIEYVIVYNRDSLYFTFTSSSRHFSFGLRHLNSLHLLYYWIGENYTLSSFFFPKECEIGLQLMSRKTPRKSGCERKIAPC